MSIDHPAMNGSLVHSAMQLSSTVIGHLKVFPKLVAKIIREDMWRKYKSKSTGNMVTNRTFEEFLQRRLPDGLETDIDTLRHLCARDPEALGLIETVVAR